MTDIHFDVLLFTAEEGYYDKEFLSLGGRIFRIPYYEGKNTLRKRLDYYIRYPRIFLGTYRLLKMNENYDAIHCHNYFESGICVLAARLAGVKVRISHCHNVSAGKTNNIRVIYEYILHLLIKKHANVRIGCSKKATVFLFGPQDTKAFVVNNAIDITVFDKTKNKRTVNTEVIRFIHIGRYCPQKNQLFLIEIFSKICKKIDKVELTLIGFGEDKALIRGSIRTMGLDNSVKMLPHDTDISKCLSEADYMIFPSIYEGLGIVLLEAQVMGLQCFVSTAVPPEANMGLCIYLDLKLGSDGWADYIINFISEDDKRDEKIVKSDIIEKYDIREICKIYSKIYDGEMKSDESSNFNSA